MCLKKSKEGKCGWSDMSDEKRIRYDFIEITRLGHFKGSGFYPEVGSSWIVQQKSDIILSYSLIKSLLIAVLSRLKGQGWKQED